MCPLPETHRLPGLGQKVVILFLQALGQSLQVLQFLIHGLGKLQSLLGTEWGRGQVGHMGERKTEITDVDPLRATEKFQTETQRKKEGKRLSVGDRNPVST